LLGYHFRSFQCSVVYGECLLPMHGRPFDIESRMLVIVQKYFTTVFQPHIPFNLLTIAFGLRLDVKVTGLNADLFLTLPPTRCIKKMDHHCPWVNSCVGHDNHAAFTRFTFYVPFGCIHGIILSANFVYHLFIYVSIVALSL